MIATQLFLFLLSNISVANAAFTSLHPNFFHVGYPTASKASLNSDKLIIHRDGRKHDHDHHHTQLFGGFGSSDDKRGGKKMKGGDSTKSSLKPKKQWNSYLSDGFKNVPKVTVGVRMISDDDDDNDIDRDTANSWMSVGFVKSVDGKYTSYALLRQRALIADHAKRLYPLQIRSNARLEWGYNEKGDDEETEWVAVPAKEFNSLESPEKGDKDIGFEGFGDPSSGFYCHYDGGKLVNERVGATSKYNPAERKSTQAQSPRRTP